MKPMPRLNLSLVIPAYNEEATIVDTVRAYKETLSKEKILANFELIVVSNNCKDRTPALCADLAKSTKKNRARGFPLLHGKGRRRTRRV